MQYYVIIADNRTDECSCIQCKGGVLRGRGSEVLNLTWLFFVDHEKPLEKLKLKCENDWAHYFQISAWLSEIERGEGVRWGKYLYLCSLCLASNKGEREKEEEEQAERAHAWPCQGVSAWRELGGRLEEVGSGNKGKWRLDTEEKRGKQTSLLLRIISGNKQLVITLLSSRKRRYKKNR